MSWLSPLPGRTTLDLGYMEVLERATGGRATLTLVARAVLRTAIRVLGRAGQPEEAELADFHAGPKLDRQGSGIRQLERHVATEARVDEAGRRMREQTEPTQGRLALKPGGKIAGQRHDLETGTEDELARMQDQRLTVLDLDQPSELGLVFGWVDEGIPVVVEQAKVLVQAHIDA